MTKALDTARWNKEKQKPVRDYLKTAKGVERQKKGASLEKSFQPTLALELPL